MTKTLTLGFLSSSTQDSYEQALYSGIDEAAQTLGAHVICITSGAIRAYRGFEFQRNVLFDLLTPQNVDGLIISGTLAHPISKEENEAFFKRFENIPSISIALNMPGIPSVMVNSQHGLRLVMQHLLQTHGYTRLAFIRGPQGHQEAEERFQAFTETLAEHGLPLDENLIVQGDYTFASGQEAMRELLSRPGATFQAVVSANDSMALGAMKIFRETGRKIPEDAAFTGFDDTLNGRFDPCPLTSIRQNVYEQGVLATHLLVKRIAGHPLAERNASPARLVVRQSCGCSGLFRAETSSTLPLQPHWETTLPTFLPSLEQIILAEFAHLPQEQVQPWVKIWLEALLVDLKTDTPPTFYQAMETTQREGVKLGIELSIWSRALASFFHEIKGSLPTPPLQHMAAQIEYQAQIRLGVTSEKLEKEEQIALEQQAVSLREISETLMTTFDLAGVLEVLSTELPRINVQACYLCLFEDPQHPADESRLIYGWANGERLTLPPEGVSFPSKKLLPPLVQGGLASSGWVIEALYSKEDRLGFMILKVRAENISVSNGLRALLSGALQGVFLLDQRIKAEEQLVHSQHELEALVDKLAFSNRELEAFAYSVSHDLRAPLRAVNAYVMMLNEKLGNTIVADDQLLLAKIAQSSIRMSQLIDGLLEISRIGRKPLNMVEIDLNQLVQNAIDTLDPETALRQIEWMIKPLDSARGDPVLLQQVYTNLLSNAVKYTSTRETAQIELGCQVTEQETIYFVRDNGVGFNMDYAGKLFGVFQRLHTETEFPGIGIGLATVQRIIHRHGGRIWVQAEEDKGATFYFTLTTDGE